MNTYFHFLNAFRHVHTVRAGGDRPDGDNRQQHSVGSGPGFEHKLLPEQQVERAAILYRITKKCGKYTVPRLLSRARPVDKAVEQLVHHERGELVQPKFEQPDAQRVNSGGREQQDATLCSTVERDTVEDVSGFVRRRADQKSGNEHPSRLRLR